MMDLANLTFSISKLICETDKMGGGEEGGGNKNGDKYKHILIMSKIYHVHKMSVLDSDQYTNLLSLISK